MSTPQDVVFTGLSVLIVSNLYPPNIIGGAEVVAHRQAIQLQARGFRVCVFAGKVSAGEVQDGLTAHGGLDVEYVDGIKVYRTTLFSFGVDDNFVVRRNTARLASIIRTEDITLVHFHNVIGLGTALIPEARALGCKVVITLHDHWGFCYRATSLRDNGDECTQTDECGSVCKPAIKPTAAAVSMPMRLRRDFVKWCVLNADMLLSPSEALRDSYRRAGIGTDQLFFALSNGIDLADISTAPPSPSAQTRFAVIAYLGEHKGVLNIIEAARILQSDPALNGKWSLSLVGDGHLRQNLQESIEAAGLDGIVTLPGHIPRADVLTLLGHTDVVMLPSRWPENEPVSMLEAIASGRAQIATRIGGLPALIDEGASGQLVPPNDPAQIATAMRAYIVDPQLARQHGQYNLTRRDQFSEVTTVLRLIEHYKTVLTTPTLPITIPMVVCGGDWPVSRVAFLCSNLHRLEARDTKCLLIWHDWLTSKQQSSAALFWNWSSGCDPQLARTMAQLGIPILAPRSGRWFASLSQMYGGIRLYDTYLEAAQMLGQIRNFKSLVAAFRSEARQAAAEAVNTDPTESFILPMTTAIVEYR